VWQPYRQTRKDERADYAAWRQRRGGRHSVGLLSAGQGNANGQNNLDMYEFGRGGLPKDEREAARLYKIAAEQGNAYAREALKRLVH